MDELEHGPQPKESPAQVSILPDHLRRSQERHSAYRDHVPKESELRRPQEGRQVPVQTVRSQLPTVEGPALSSEARVPAHGHVSGLPQGNEREIHHGPSQVESLREQSTQQEIKARATGRLAGRTLRG